VPFLWFKREKRKHETDMKEKIRGLFVLLLGVVITLSFFGCRSDKHLDEMYEYKVYSKSITIYGLKGDAADMNPIQFPYAINGKSVVQIGYSAFMSGNLYVDTSNAYKAILPYTVKTLHKYAFETKTHIKFEVAVSRYGVIEIGAENFSNRYYFIGEILDQMKEEYANQIAEEMRDEEASGRYPDQREVFAKANILYYFNYETAPNGGYFLCDYVSGGYAVEPMYPPQRKGYTFDGWYKEPDCLNRWDFKDQKRVTGTKELYAKWNKKWSNWSCSSA
jgi:uncharacterized repeat protein (TIGR02543 family)